MRIAKLMMITLAVAILLFPSGTVLSQSGKVPTVNTRGACLNVNEFVGLIQHESRRLKSGDNVRLIVDIPNETEAREAIEKTGYPIVEETRDVDRDLLDFLLEVKK